MTRAIWAMCPKIVGDPGREQLTQADLSEFGMLTREIELRIAQPPGRERGEIVGAQPGEFIEELRQ